MNLYLHWESWFSCAEDSWHPYDLTAIFLFSASSTDDQIGSNKQNVPETPVLKYFWTYFTLKIIAKTIV